MEQPVSHSFICPFKIFGIVLVLSIRSCLSKGVFGSRTFVRGFSSLFVLHSSLVRFEILLFLKIIHKSLHSSALQIFCYSFLFLFLLSKSAVFLQESCDLILRQRPAAFCKVLHDSWPFQLPALIFWLHSVENLLECFLLNSRSTFWITSNSSRQRFKFRIFASGKEKLNALHNAALLFRIE